MTKQELVTEVLKKMTKDKWTKYVLARDKWRHEVDYTSSKAVRFCASGWCSRIAVSVNQFNLSMDVTRDFKYKYDTYIHDVNDDHGYKAVVEKLKNLYKD